MTRTRMVWAPGSGVSQHALRLLLRLTVIAAGVVVACWIGAHLAHADSATSSSDVLSSTTGAVIGSSSNQLPVTSLVATRPTSVPRVKVPSQPATSTLTAPAQALGREIATTANRLSGEVTTTVHSVGSSLGGLRGFLLGHATRPGASAPPRGTAPVSPSSAPVAPVGASWKLMAAQHAVGCALCRHSSPAPREALSACPTAPYGPAGGQRLPDAPLADGGLSFGSAASHAGGQRQMAETPMWVWRPTLLTDGLRTGGHANVTYWLENRSSRPD